VRRKEEIKNAARCGSVARQKAKNRVCIAIGIAPTPLLPPEIK
jgi:hypothetical protein